MEPPSTLGQVLRQARRRKRLSQGALATRLGVTQATISYVEGGRDVKLGTLTEIARALDLEPLLVPRALVPVVLALAESRKPTPPAIFSGDSDERYDEADE